MCYDIFMKAIPAWIKSGLVVLIGLITLWFLLTVVTNFFGIQSSNLTYNSGYQSAMAPSSKGFSMGMGNAEMATDAMVSRTSYPEPIPPIDPDVPPTTSSNRLVITDTSLAMVVSSVEDTISQIDSLVTSANGFIVNSFVNRPSEAATGSIEIRVPTNQRDQVVASIKALGLRITSEHVTGRDVTDQYEDLQARLNVLETTKAKFEEIQAQATEIEDLLNVQRELISVQAQIDQVKGRAQYLEKSAELSRVSVSLATDELALPLTPDNAWRPVLVFKEATRSMFETLRSLAYAGIWLGVYAIIWVPGLIIFYFILRFVQKRQQKI